MMKQYSQLTSAVLMVRPVDFAFNSETALDNVFQKNIEGTDEEIRKRALSEFEGMVTTLRDHGAEVYVLEASDNHRQVKTPDAVFPNNWLGSDQRGNLFVFPMLTPNRQAEKRIEDVEGLLLSAGFQIHHVIHVGPFSRATFALEGTGSLIFDHREGIVYAALSKRCELEPLRRFCDLLGYRVLVFETRDQTGREVYHTNVVMSVGREFAVICADVITSGKEQILSALCAHRTVIEISASQMSDSFCGNILQINSRKGEPLIVLSRTAYLGFSPEQREQLSRYGTLVPVTIDTIETVGGGSARCMMAEIFLPKVS